MCRRWAFKGEPEARVSGRVQEGGGGAGADTKVRTRPLGSQRPPEPMEEVREQGHCAGRRPGGCSRRGGPPACPSLSLLLTQAKSLVPRQRCSWGIVLGISF